MYKLPKVWQADGTLAQLVGDKGVLTAMLEPLCGWGCDKEGDAGVRESLAEALMMLVSCLGSLATIMQSMPLAMKQPNQEGCAAGWLSAGWAWQVFARYEGLPRHGLTYDLPPVLGAQAVTDPKSAWVRCLYCQAETDAGRKALWGVRAPEMLRKGCGPGCPALALACGGRSIHVPLHAAPPSA